MGYSLGVDLGTTYTAAAVSRDGRAEIIPLGNRAAAIPSVVFLREDGVVLTGDAANRRSLAEPGRVAREFKRRVGDPTPILLGGTPQSAEALLSKLLRAVVDQVVEREGSRPDHVAVSHPANWGPYKQDLLSQAVRLADLGAASTVTEPEAAAIHYAATEHIEPGEVVAVYDLGGGTFDAAVLRRTAMGFEVLGEPEGIERLGGIDFDAAVYAFVDRALGDTLDNLDPEDPTAIAAVARLREECVGAKEALSSDTDATIPVLLPHTATEVRITRGEFEEMIRPILADTIGALRRALRSADVPAERVARVLLVGGSSRIPLVGQLVGAELGRPVAVDAHPKHTVALGAARFAALKSGAAPTATATPPPGVHVAEPAPEPISPAALVAPIAPPGEWALPQTEPVVPIAAEPPPAPPPEPPPLEAPPTRPPPIPPDPYVPPYQPNAATMAIPPVQPPPPGEAAPGSGGGNGNGKSNGKGRPVLLAVAVVVLVAAIVVIAVVLTRNNDGTVETGGTTTAAPTENTDPPTTSAPPSTGSDPTTTSTTVAQPLYTPPNGMDSDCDTQAQPYVCITNIEFDAETGDIKVDFETQGFDALLPAEENPGSNHIHFFLDIFNQEDTGTQQDTQFRVPWHIWDGVQPFGGNSNPNADPGYTKDSFGAEGNGGATGICALVADTSHATEADTGNCFAVPPEAIQ